MIEVLYSDAQILAVNKPPDLRVIPDGYDPSLPYLSALLAPELGRLWVVHRLDRDTSGVVLLARSAEAHRALSLAFENRETRKIYHALVCGKPEQAQWTCDLPLRIDADRRHRTLPDPLHGKPARTDFQVLNRFPEVALIEARPHTGYTHQIRAHLAAARLPLLADPLYWIPGLPAPSPLQSHSGLIGRTALHHLEITFPHPATSVPTQIQAGYPTDFQLALKTLEDRAGDSLSQ